MGTDEESLKEITYLNPCWQLTTADAFKWRNRDKGTDDYVEDFVARSFVYLEDGLTFLTDTRRKPANVKLRPGSKRKIPRANLPEPWVQYYIPIWKEHSGRRDRPGGNSLDRPVYPIIGAVSHDAKYIAAFAWPETRTLSQFWHDCYHAVPSVVDFYQTETNKIVSRGRIYYMKNDEQALLDAFKRDFPDWERPAGVFPTPEY